MGKYAKSYFENPYLEEDNKDSKYKAEVIMDEARQKWRAGGWRAQSEAFEFEREQLTAENEGEESKAERPSSSRFDLDVHRDLTGETISLKTLQELDYSASYRPKGNLEERMVGQRSTMQRYDILAGELEAPPEDLSFMSDAEARRERDEQKGELRSGRLRRDTRRLDSSVDERRSELMRMLPDTDTSAAKSIVKETVRRKERTDAELGKNKKNRRNYNYREGPQKNADPNSDEAFARRLAASRLDRLPEQAGMGENSMELPEFTTEARYWSQIPVDNPTWSEIAAHSVYTVPQDEDDSRVDPRFIRQEGEDDRSEYGFTASRARLKSEEAGEFKNEYIKEANIDPERIKQIMEHRYRGRWIPPEFFADDRLVEDYFHALSSGQTRGEDFVTWAYNRKMAEQQSREMQEQARRQYARAVRAQQTALRRAQAMAAKRNDDAKRRYEEARRRGYQQGAAMNRQRKRAAHQPMGQPLRAPLMNPPQMPPMTMPYMPPMPSMAPMPPMQGYDPYGGYSGMTGGTAGSGYHGQYPELFEGRSTQPTYYPQPKEFIPPDDGK